jgi:endoglucanase
MDWEWNKDERAKELLSRYHYLDQEWEKNKAIYATYAHDGQAMTRSEVPAMYGGTIGYFLVAQSKAEAEDIYKAKLESVYSPDFQDWKERLGYYDDNWSWFGVALYNGQLPNLFRLPAG